MGEIRDWEKEEGQLFHSLDPLTALRPETTRTHFKESTPPNPPTSLLPNLLSKGPESLQKAGMTALGGSFRLCWTMLQAFQALIGPSPYSLLIAEAKQGSKRRENSIRRWVSWTTEGGGGIYMPDNWLMLSIS